MKTVQFLVYQTWVILMGCEQFDFKKSRLKAQTIYQIYQIDTIADDTGLDELFISEPGFSARYAGPQ